jgi:protein arginine N-methyltransferase 5
MRLHSETQSQAYRPSDAMEGPSGKPCGNLGAMETSYVVRTHAVVQTHKELPCWTFSHPKKTDERLVKEDIMNNDHNERHAKLNFTDCISSSVGYKCGYGNHDQTITKIASSASNDLNSNGSYTLHGFLGTFYCLLYESIKKKAITISIAPNSFSTGMYSWFPLYFPLREPLTVPFRSSVRCNIWRKSDAKAPSQVGGSVWYEWYAEVIDKDSGLIISSSNLHNPNGRGSKILL